VRVQAEETHGIMKEEALTGQETENEEPLHEEQWEGFGDDELKLDASKVESVESVTLTESHNQTRPKVHQLNKHSHTAVKRRPDLIGKDKKRRKGKNS
jgi:hypothetical protein